MNEWIDKVDRERERERERERGGASKFVPPPLGPANRRNRAGLVCALRCREIEGGRKEGKREGKGGERKESSLTDG